MGEGEKRIYLEDLLESLGLKDSVWLPGFVKNPYTYMVKSNLFVLSSKYEGFPNVLIEALACGLPIVSTDCPSGPREILDNGKYGKLVPVGDVDSLAKAMEETLNNPVSCKDLQERSRCFSIDRIFKQYLNLINNLK